jgi:hypothetical protein
MRKPSQQLRKLIRSLSPQELKYLRQDISSNKELDSEQYLRMIDLIFQAEEPYDESLVRKKMKSGYFVTHFSQAKANLYSLISASLLRFYRQKDIALDFIDRLGWVELLSQRDMSSQLDEQLEGLKEISNRSELLWMNFLVQQWQFKAAIQSGNPERLKLQLNQMATEGAVLIRNLNLLHRLQECYLKIMHFYYTQGFVSKSDSFIEMDKLYQEVLEIEKQEIKNYEAKIIIKKFKFIYFYCHSDERILEQSGQILELDRLMNGLGKACSLDLVESLQRQMSACNALGRWAGVEEAYEDLKKISEKEQGLWLSRKELRARIVVWLSWLRTGQISKMLSSIEEQAEPAFADEDDASFRNVWYGLKCMGYLCGMKYDQLRDTALKMEIDASTELSGTHYVTMKLCLLICAYKEKDVVGFNSLFRSSVRFFEKRGVYDESLKWLCTGLNSCRRENDRERKLMLQKFCEEVYKHPDKEQLVLYKLKVFLFWAEAEWKGLPMERLFKDPDFLKRWPLS